MLSADAATLRLWQAGGSGGVMAIRSRSRQSMRVLTTPITMGLITMMTTGMMRMGRGGGTLATLLKTLMFERGGGWQRSGSGNYTRTYTRMHSHVRTCVYTRMHTYTHTLSLSLTHTYRLTHTRVLDRKSIALVCVAPYQSINKGGGS